MLNENFVFVGIAIGSIGTISYLISTIKGKTKPNKVSWFFWAAAPLIAFAAQIKQGVGVQSFLAFSVGFGPLLIFLASFLNKKSEWKLTKLDVVCGLLAFVGLILWQITQVGNVAIFFSIMADGLAAIPTIVKSYKFPQTENANAFLFGAINATFTLLTISNWQFAEAAFPLYIFIICVILFVLIKFKLGLKPQSQFAK